MIEKLDLFVIQKGKSLLEAIKKIDGNNKGFLVVLDNKSVVGTITDGDVRRAIISGYKTTDSIDDIFKKNYKFLNEGKTISDAIKVFCEESGIEFLPILNDSNILVNIVLRNSLYAKLLQDQEITLSDNFIDLSEDVLFTEIFDKPWGFYKTTVQNEYLHSKIISIEPGASLSLQSHKEREEHWIIAHGLGQAEVDGVVTNVNHGSHIYIPCNSKHRLKNISLEESLIFIEVQLGNYFGEDDITRYADEYERT